MKRYEPVCLLLAAVLLCFPGNAMGGLDSQPLENDYPYRQLLQDVASLAQEHDPYHFRFEVIGATVEERPIIALMLGRGNVYALVLAGVHANECANTPMVMQAVSDLLSRSRQGDKAVSDVLNAVTFVLVPCVNPDGYDLCVAYRRNSKGYFKKANVNGVNLNRNFPTVYWGNGKTYDKNDYAGPSPASEPETAALVSLIQKYPYSAMIDLHSRGRQIYCGKGGFDSEDIHGALSAEALDALTFELAETLLPQGYKTRPQAAGNRKNNYGSTTDYLFMQGVPAVTIETLPHDRSGMVRLSWIAKEYEMLRLPELLLHLGEAAQAFARMGVASTPQVF